MNSQQKLNFDSKKILSFIHKIEGEIDAVRMFNKQLQKQQKGSVDSLLKIMEEKNKIGAQLVDKQFKTSLQILNYLIQEKEGAQRTVSLSQLKRQLIEKRILPLCERHKKTISDIRAKVIKLQHKKKTKQLKEDDIKNMKGELLGQIIPIRKSITVRYKFIEGSNYQIKSMVHEGELCSFIKSNNTDAKAQSDSKINRKQGKEMKLEKQIPKNDEIYYLNIITMNKPFMKMGTNYFSSKKHKKKAETHFDLKLLLKNGEEEKKNAKILKSYSIQKSKGMIIPSMAAYENSFYFISTKQTELEESQVSKRNIRRNSAHHKKRFSMNQERKYPKHDCSSRMIPSDKEMPLSIFHSKQLNQEIKGIIRKSKASLDAKSFEKSQVSMAKQSSRKSIAFNVETILRRKIGIDFDTFMKEYCQRMKLQPGSKIFIINSADIWIKKALLKRGWIQNLDNDSRAFHLKWSFKVAHEKVFYEQLLNHFTGSDFLTSKDGLAKHTKNCHGLMKHIPRTYDLGNEIHDFVRNFEETTILNELKKILKQNESSQIISDHQLSQTLTRLIEKDAYVCKQKSTFLTNIVLMVQLCVFCQNIRSKMNGEMIKKKYDLNYKTIKKLMKFTELNKKNWSHYRAQSEEDVNFSKDDLNYYTANTQYGYPSQQLIDLLHGYHRYFQRNLHTYAVEGDKNLWICKNRNSARGAGIVLTSDFDQILKKKGNYLVQKYIERCCVSGGDGAKFDLRIWVLVVSFNPLIAYYYSDFYGRLCSQPYNVQSRSSSAHLTNYSINKNFFQQKQSSIIISPQFFQIMSQRLKITIKEAQQRFYTELQLLISTTLSQYKNIIKGNKTNFELYGFDILPSDKFSLHLLEVNLSPACKERNQWLTNAVERMAEQLMDIVLDNLFLQNQGWKKIK